MPQDYKFVAELNVWAKRIINNSPVYQTYKHVPVPTDETIWKKTGTILDLLFNYTYKETDFFLLYKESDYMDYTDNNVKNRLIILRGKTTLQVVDIEAPPASTYLTPDPYDKTLIPEYQVISKNIFEITYGELYMLKLLQNFKNNINVDISTIIYDDLSCLSKLIYLYLNLEINNDFSLYDDESLVNYSDRLLVTLYEKYIIDHYYKKCSYKFASSLDQTFFGNCYSMSQIIDLTSTDLTNKYWSFPSDKYPIDSRSVFVVHNSDVQSYDTDYTVLIDTSVIPHVYRLVWDGLALEEALASGNHRLYIMWTYRI